MEASCVNANGAPKPTVLGLLTQLHQSSQSLQRQRIFSYSEEIITKTGNRSAHSGLNTLPSPIRELCWFLGCRCFKPYLEECPCHMLKLMELGTVFNWGHTYSESGLELCCLKVLISERKVGQLLESVTSFGGICWAVGKWMPIKLSVCLLKIRCKWSGSALPRRPCWSLPLRAFSAASSFLLFSAFHTKWSTMKTSPPHSAF